MEAIAQVAGGVAHDFNNILTSIIGTADLCLMIGGLPDAVRADLESIRDSGRRAAAITRQLLTFSRQQVSHSRRLDVNELVRHAESLLRRQVAPAVRLEIDLAAKGVVEADPALLEQLLLNLVVNADDATTGDGTIAISTADVEVASASDDAVALPPGEYVVLRVRDTGAGMDQGTLSRMFEPFFTTKGPGPTRGLGLATVHRIAQQSRGHVRARSRPGEGALFETYFPRAPAGSLAEPITAASEDAVRGTETILVVEDEAAVRAPMCRLLRHLGYRVLEAQHGEDALTVLHKHHAPIHLLVSDLMMPEMGGSELIRLLHEWYPALRVLVVSGYSVDMIALNDELLAGTSYLPKPFTTGQLARRVREMLDAPHGQSR